MRSAFLACWREFRDFREEFRDYREEFRQYREDFRELVRRTDENFKLLHEKYGRYPRS